MPSFRKFRKPSATLKRADREEGDKKQSETGKTEEKTRAGKLKRIDRDSTSSESETENVSPAQDSRSSPVLEKPNTAKRKAVWASSSSDGSEAEQESSAVSSGEDNEEEEEAKKSSSSSTSSDDSSSSDDKEESSDEESSSISAESGEEVEAKGSDVESMEEGGGPSPATPIPLGSAPTSPLAVDLAVSSSEEMSGVEDGGRTEEDGGRTDTADEGAAAEALMSLAGSGRAEAETKVELPKKVTFEDVLGEHNYCRHPKLQAALPPPRPPKPPPFKGFTRRNQIETYNVMTSFLHYGIDQEDINFLKKAYDRLLAEDQHAWVNDTHWVWHPPTFCPPSRDALRRRSEEHLPEHSTGCARTEGYYKVDRKTKQRHKFTLQRELAEAPVTEAPKASLAERESSKIKPTQTSVSREVRSFQRRLLTAFGNEATESELLKFNQLKFRKKLLKFGKSRIHDWGLFAMEAIAADEMVIEYVGQTVRSIMSDVREKAYTRQGIGSSYLFRVDAEHVIDATKCGNLARFINHSCNPNCYAKIVTLETRKKIVIYSKQAIQCGEEITYDYKFPIEEEKILCLCGAPQCKGTLN